MPVNRLSFLSGKLPFQQGQPVGHPATAKSPTRTPGQTKARRPRFLYVLAFFIFWSAVICLRLVWLQVVMRRVYVEKAERQQQRSFEVEPRRGILYDRNLHELALTVLADSVFAVPYEVAGAKSPDEAAKANPADVAKTKLAAANALAAVLHTDPTDSFTSADRIDARLTASRDFAWIARKLNPATIAKVKALNLKGVYVQKEFQRSYPDSQIAAQVLGYVDIDGKGLGGLELNFEDNLHGTPGHMLNLFDAKRHVTGSHLNEPIPGENLVLTLDENIQFKAEQALDHAMERTKALNGTVVVQDPHTGQILALATRPTFDPNDFRHATKELLRDHAVSDVYEPGSTFKLVTYSAALEEKVTTPEKLIDCHGGAMNVAGRIVHDDHYNGVMTTSQALWVSSDVAAIQLGQRMGSNTFYKYIRAYGFGDRSGIEVPGETRGLLKPVRRWNPTTIGSIPMGQEIAVTPVQLITMVSTIANGGMYLPPHLLLNSTDEVKGSAKLKASPFHPEGQLPATLPDGSHRVISTMTAALMRTMMEGVVLYGTGKNAQLNGYSSAGKTGTAQKIDVLTHKYSKTKYVASFVGFAPVNNPAISIAVIMDSPSDGGHHGAQASAPVFHELAQQVLEYLGVPHDIEMKSEPQMAKALASDGPQEHAAEPNENIDDLFAEVNDLPADDPLRRPMQAEAQPLASDPTLTMPVLPADTKQSATAAPSQALVAQAMPAAPQQAAPAPFSMMPASSASSGGSSIVLDSGQRVSVPSFLGQPVRHVIEQAGGSGLTVQVLGNGTAREQAPIAGTMVPSGTKVVVRFTH